MVFSMEIVLFFFFSCARLIFSRLRVIIGSFVSLVSARHLLFQSRCNPLNGYIRMVKPFVDVSCICGKFERIKFVCVTRIIERMKIFHIKKIINYFYR